MNSGTYLRVILAVPLLVYGFLEIWSYRAEWKIAQANALIEAVLLGRTSAGLAVENAQRAQAAAKAANQLLHHDPRALLAEANALVMLGRGNEAIASLNQRLAYAERPELWVALGRALAAVGDEAGAQAAFLRAAWISPLSIATLPRAARTKFLEVSAQREAEATHTGDYAPPPEPNTPR
jgi:tetratricopeptide (TPR) repeat protein